MALKHLVIYVFLTHAGGTLGVAHAIFFYGIISSSRGSWSSSNIMRDLGSPLFEDYSMFKDSDEAWCSPQRKAALEFAYLALRLSFADLTNDAIRFLQLVREDTTKCTDFAASSKNFFGVEIVKTASPLADTARIGISLSDQCGKLLQHDPTCLNHLDQGCQDFVQHEECINMLTLPCANSIYQQCKKVYARGCRKCFNDYYDFKQPLSNRGIHVDEYRLPHTCTAETLKTLDATLFALRVWHSFRPGMLDHGLRPFETRSLSTYLVPDRTKADDDRFIKLNCQNKRTTFSYFSCVKQFHSRLVWRFRDPTLETFYNSLWET